MPDLEPAREVEFESRQALANAADAEGVAQLVLDGYQACHLSPDDDDLRQAWQELVDAVEAQQRAVQRVKDLLPESSQGRFWRERTEEVERG